MSEAAREYSKSPRGILAAWSGWICGPAAWGLHLTASYLLVGPACYVLGEWVLHLTSLVAALIALAGMYFAWRAWNRVGRGWPQAEGGAIGRARFLSLSGLILSGYFLLIVLAQAIPAIIMSPCA